MSERLVQGSVAAGGWSAKRLGLLLGPTVFGLILLAFEPHDMSWEARAVLASAAWIAIWWITEAIPMAATALLPIVLFPLTGGLEVQATTAAYGHRYIFLYIGGFLLAIAIERWGLHQRIALAIIYGIGANVNRLILGFMLATAGLSMWISNTATSVMMLPIGMAIIARWREQVGEDADSGREFGRALMLGVAYSASIGGMATLVGTPPNLILAGVVQELYGVEISFAQWFMFGLPTASLLFVICFFYLTRVAFSFSETSMPGGRAEIGRQLRALGRMAYAERLVLVVFAFTALAWIGRSFIQKQLGWLPRLDDTIIAMIAGLVLFLLPSGRGSENRRALLTWEDAKGIPWGIVLLFGGGMALAEGFKASGLAVWIGGQLTLLDGVSFALLVLLLVAAVNFLTEITSNIATTSMLLPILAPMALAMGVHPYVLMVAATVAASCAFMLPVATPPNAVVFGSGYLRIPEMVRTGFGMNLLSILVLALLVHEVLPRLWGFDPQAFPEAWRP